MKGICLPAGLIVATAFLSQTVIAATATKNIKRWPNGVVPYVIDMGDAEQAHINAINEAIHEWNSKTVVKFVERSSGLENQYPDYIEINASSAVCGTLAKGVAPGKQNVDIGRSCTLGHFEKSGAAPKRGAIHELGHAIGLAHEQTRFDAPNYISLNLCALNDKLLACR